MIVGLQFHLSTSSERTMVIMNPEYEIVNKLGSILIPVGIGTQFVRMLFSTVHLWYFFLDFITLRINKEYRTKKQTY